MIPVRTPPDGSNPPSHRSRRRSDLTLPLPQRNTHLAVPLPLPPPSASALPSSAPSTSAGRPRQLDFSDLDRISRIGSGNGGTVYKVVHRPTGRHYALKVIHGDHHEEHILRQIRREVQILRDVDDPNVIRCHDMSDRHGTSTGEIYLLLEFMDGGSLHGAHIGDERRLSGITHQILKGLHYLHARKIVHRDIKPSNLLINSRNQVKIADFGVSRALSQTMDCNSSVGTIAYMSPERIDTDMNKGSYDGYLGDIWSLGVSVLEVYLGRFPFGVAGDWSSLFCAICMAEPPQAPPSASQELRHFIACCLQRDPARRWTAEKLLRHPFVSRNGNDPPNLHRLLPPPRTL